MGSAGVRARPWGATFQLVPNWCDNRLAIRGRPAQVMELVERLEGATPLDFGSLLPMPEEIRAGADYHAPGVPDELPGWYQWAREHWGVKWNATGVSRRGYGRTGRVRYRFFTAYGPPTEFLDVVAALYPAVELDLRYEVELMGGGAAFWRGGELERYEGDSPY